MTEAALQAALGPPPPDLAAAAAQLGVTKEALRWACLKENAMKTRIFSISISAILFLSACGPTSSLSSHSVIMSMSWADHITITSDNVSFTFASNGIPDHEYLDVYTGFDLDRVTTFPTYVVESPLEVSITLSPQLTAEPTFTGLNEIGVIISGAPLNNPYEADQEYVALDDAFVENGIPFLDSCNGHPTPPGAYHYHGISVCTTKVVDSPDQHSVVIGIALDGFPIYGSQDKNSTPPTNLNQCSGHVGPTPKFPDGIFHYHLTQVSPYNMVCFSGVIEGYDPPTLEEIEASFDE